MMRLMLAIVVVLWAATGALAAGYSDPRGRFTVDLPDGWFQTEADNPQFDFTAAKLGDSGIEGVCVVQVKMAPQLNAYSQAQIDAEIARDYSKKWWEDAFRNHDVRDATIWDHGYRKARSGIVLYVVVTASVAVANTGTRVALKFREEGHVRPGTLHDLTCISLKIERYDALEPEFVALLSSYEPGPSLVSGLQPNARSSALLLYSQAGLEGQQVALTQDLTSVSPTAWLSRPGSIKVDGNSAWEVCEGPNFSGRCTLLSGVYTTPPSSSFAIGSARQARATTLEHLFSITAGAGTQGAAKRK